MENAAKVLVEGFLEAVDVPSLKPLSAFVEEFHLSGSGVFY